ncbi:Inner membrane transport protein YeaN [Kluyvera intermedia]|nr:Inner membrane transport protein YeaN [Kluyvera intermedia]
MSYLSSSSSQRGLLIVGILLIASTLRVTFTGAAPLLDAIRADYGLTTAQTGLLTTLPLLAFGLVSPLAAGIARRLGMERSLFIAMGLICAGIAIRSLPLSCADVYRYGGHWLRDSARQRPAAGLDKT